MDFNKLYIAWTVVFVLCVPLSLNLIPPNRFYGFRTASTLSSPRIWAKANIFAGWTFMVSALVGAAITYLWPVIAESLGGLLVAIVLGVALLISLLYLKSIAP